MEELFLTYRDMLFKTKRGNNCGIVSNAKPLYVISIIDAIDEEVIIDNKIYFDCPNLLEIYKHNYMKHQNDGKSMFRANAKVTPFNMPYFHLNAEPCYHIKWKEGIKIPKQAQSPSNKFLKESVEFAFLDINLWNLLKNPLMRHNLQESLITKFILE